MKIFTDPELTQQVYGDYLKYFQWYQEILEKEPNLSKNLPFDHRDLLFFNFMMNFGKADWTKEEFDKTLHETVHELKTNPAPLYDKFYDIMETFDMTAQPNNTREDIFKCLVAHGSDQCYTTLLLANPEYKQQRYGSSLEGQQKFETQSIRLLAQGQYINNDFVDLKISFDARGYLTDDQQQEIRERDRSEFVNVIKEALPDLFYRRAKAAAENPNEFEFEVPEYVTYIPEAADNCRDPHAECDERFVGDDNYDTFFQNFRDSIFPESTYGRNCYMTTYGNLNGHNIYIDGERLPLTLDTNQVDGYQYNLLAAEKLARAMMEGRAIDIVKSYEVNGKLEHKILPLKYKFNKAVSERILDKYCKEHNISWVHRHWFNWGPFRIKCAAKDFNARNAQTQAQRAEKINGYWMTEEERLYREHKQNPEKIATFVEEYKRETEKRYRRMHTKQPKLAEGAKTEEGPIEVNEAKETIIAQEDDIMLVSNEIPQNAKTNDEPQMQSDNHGS